MKLIPQRWTWDGTNPQAAWLANCPAGVPMVWQAGLPQTPDTRSYLTSLLSPEEIIRLSRYSQREDQLRFLAGRGLLRLFIGAHMNTPAERVKFNAGPFGKPFVVPSPGAPALHFNVSHSGKLVLLAFSPMNEVGVDVEEIRGDLDFEPIARHIFPPGEYTGWLRLNPAERLDAFHQAWTRHEAGSKAMGLGFAGERTAALTARLELFDLVLPDGYCGAVGCLRSPAI